jgi:hypothetical protein
MPEEGHAAGRATAAEGDEGEEGMNLLEGVPSDNLTTGERSQSRLDWTYTLALDLIDGQGWRTRFWFRSVASRQAFADILNRLHDQYGHEMRAEIV